MPTTVLIVDDHAGFRRAARTLLEAEGYAVTGESATGSEALAAVERLRPEVVLLDIGLPILNGIEAARQILGLVPKTKIMFLSQESSTDIVQEAMSLGAWGYVLKTHVRIAEIHR